MSEQMATSRAGTDAIIALARAEALAALVQHQRQRVDQILAAAKAGAPIEGAGATFYEVFVGYTRLCRLTLDSGCDPAAQPGLSVTFAKLKEEMGQERGFLCGVLALPDEAVITIPSRAFADFVVCLWSQKAHLAAMRDMMGKTGHAAGELDLSSVEASGELAAIQRRLLTKFDVRGVRSELTVSRWWGLITDHIDKMYSIHERIVAAHATPEHSHQPADDEAEIGSEIGALVSSAAALIGVPRARGADGSASVAEVLHLLAESSAEALKAELLRLVGLVARRALEGADGERGARAGAEAGAAGAEARESVQAELSKDDGACRVPDEWRIELAELSFEAQIGDGVAGTTYRAQWRANSTVAVKVANAGSLKDWRAETAALMRLRHPNVIRCFGVVVSPPTFCLVLEYCGGGDVFHALQRATPPGFFFRVAEGAAAGMAYLHSLHIIHRDLKSSNLLLDSSGTPKLIDFGTAIEHGAASASAGEASPGVAALTSSPAAALHTAEKGTYRWMAPEVINHEAYSRSADVFSYAMLLFELLTHEYPFADKTQVMAAACVAVHGFRPPLPRGTPAAVGALLTSCWQAEASRRPTFLAITELLSRMRGEGGDALTAAELAWLDDSQGHPVYHTRAHARTDTGASSASESSGNATNGSSREPGAAAGTGSETAGRAGSTASSLIPPPPSKRRAILPIAR